MLVWYLLWGVLVALSHVGNWPRWRKARRAISNFPGSMPGKGIQGEAGLEESLHVWIWTWLEMTSLTWTGCVLTHLPKPSGRASALLDWTGWWKGLKAHLHPLSEMEGPFLAVQQLCGLKQAQVLLVCTENLSLSITSLDLDQLHSYLLSWSLGLTQDQLPALFLSKFLPPRRFSKANKA